VTIAVSSERVEKMKKWPQQSGGRMYTVHLNLPEGRIGMIHLHSPTPHHYTPAGAPEHNSQVTAPP
jgi:hypothetical protein